MRGRPPHIAEDTILDAAREVFLRDRHSATTAEIARRAGVSEGILFYRYKTKDGLLAAVIRRQARMNAELTELCAAPGTGDQMENLFRIVMAMLKNASRTYPLIELVETGRISPGFLKQLLPPDQPIAPIRDQNLIESYLRAEIAAGRLPDIDAANVALTLVGTSIFFFRFNLDATPETHEAFARSLVNLVMNGIGRGC